jgi:hypothetical protein
MRTINEHGNNVVTPVNNALTISRQQQPMVAVPASGVDPLTFATRR